MEWEVQGGQDGRRLKWVLVRRNCMWRNRICWEETRALLEETRLPKGGDHDGLIGRPMADMKPLTKLCWRGLLARGGQRER